MRYNFPIVYGPKTAYYDLPNGTDRKLVVSNRISLGILDMTENVFSKCSRVLNLLFSKNGIFPEHRHILSNVPPPGGYFL